MHSAEVTRPELPEHHVQLDQQRLAQRDYAYAKEANVPSNLVYPDQEEEKYDSVFKPMRRTAKFMAKMEGILKNDRNVNLRR